MELETSKKLIIKSIETINKLKTEKNSNNNIKNTEINKLSWKDAKSGKINSDELKKLMYLLIEADDYLYKTAPTHYLTDEEAKEFCKLLFKSKNHIDNLLNNFGYSITTNNFNIDLNTLYIVGNKKTVKILKDIEPNINIISTEGVLEPEDMKKINPKINDKALLGIEKKCNITKNQINKLIDIVKPLNGVVVIVDENNIADELIYNSAKKYWNASKINIETILEGI